MHFGLNRVQSAATCSARAFYLLIAASVVGGPATAHAFGFKGEVIDLVSMTRSFRGSPSSPSGKTATIAERNAAADTFISTLNRDSDIAEIGKRMQLQRHLYGMAAGSDLDVVRYRADARAAIRSYVQQSNQNELVTKLKARSVADASTILFRKMEAIEMALTAPATAAGGNGEPRGLDAIISHPLVPIYGKRYTRPVLLEQVPNARLKVVNARAVLPGAGQRDARKDLALAAYGRQIAQDGQPRADAIAALSYVEGGRAVVGAENVPLRPGSHVVTEEVNKGIGSTPFAGKTRFNHRATALGAFSVQEGLRDWRNAMALKRAGVPVYEPVAMVMFPYLEWHESRGWEAMGNYVRRPQESLRVSELDLLKSDAQAAHVVKRLKGKISGLLADAGRDETISDADVTRFFVQRLGRIAGLFQGGGFGGKKWFHGMLHRQNISLLGEIVDIGWNLGVMKSDAEYQAAWERSNYPRWSEEVKAYRRLQGATSEADVLRYMAHRFNWRLASTTCGLSDQELDALFDRAYQEGLRGVRADDPSLFLRDAPIPTSTGAH